jgi:hypothetical protein
MTGGIKAFEDRKRRQFWFFVVAAGLVIIGLWLNWPCSVIALLAYCAGFYAGTERMLKEILTWAYGLRRG